MNIKDRIKKVGQYFVDMRITTVEGEQVIYIIVDFPRNWIVDEDIEEKFAVNVWQNDEGNNQYTFCTTIDNGEDVLFDAIDYSINKMKSIIERTNLLAAKQGELRALFEDEEITLAQLKTLKFNYDKNAKDENTELVIPNSRGRRSNKDKDNQEDESNKNDNEE